MIAFTGHVSISRVSCNLRSPGWPRQSFDKVMLPLSSVTVLGIFQYTPILLQDCASAGIKFEVTVELGQQRSEVPLPKAFQQRTVAAVKETISSGDLVDLKFYAYTKRRKEGGVKEPKPLYASGAILAKFGCEFLDDLGEYSHRTGA